MKIRSSLLIALSVLVLAGSAAAHPGAVFLEGRGGALIPVGDFEDEQHVGGAYSLAAGYEFIPFLDLLLEFTHSFNDNKDGHDTVEVRGVTFVSDETKQNFVLGLGPRVNFLPSDSPVRPYGTFKTGWYHFANFNSIEVNGREPISDNDQDAFGLEAGLGLTGTVFTLFEHENDEIPLFEMTVGAHGSYHHAFLGGRDDRQFVTVMGSLGFRF